jgi:hypothetical protein
MMGILMPETCWAVSVQQGNKFYDCLLHLVGCFIRANIVNYIKDKKLEWAGHLICMNNNKT